MQRRGPIRDLWFASVLTTALAATTASRAAPGAGLDLCEGAMVRLEGHPGPAWKDTLERLCARVLTMRDRDPSASLRLVAEGTSLVVEVTLGDGRTAIRRIESPSSFDAVLEALLTLPPSSAGPGAPPALPPASAPSSPTTAAASAPPPLPPPGDSPPRKVESDSTAEIALAAVGRVAGNGSTSIGGAAEAFLPTGRWRLGLWARWDAFQTVSAPPAMDYEIDTAGVGIAVARRVELGPAAIDIGFAPRLIVETESFEVAELDGEDDETRTTTDVRLATFGRAVFGRGPVRGFVGLDAELSPARVRRKVRSDPRLPALPAWSAGLSLGVSWTAP